MLVLSRKPGEKVVIDGGITITVVEVIGNRVRIGIDAPDQIKILRGELVDCQDSRSSFTPDLTPEPVLATEGVTHPDLVLTR